MQKELSTILRDKLIGLPFIDVFAGLAQTVTTEDMDEVNVVKIVKRFPVSYDVVGIDCQGKEIMLIPDSKYKGMVYFEDYGVISAGRQRGRNAYQANLRLVCWMNRGNLVGDDYMEISGRTMATIIDTLSGKNPENIGMFTRLTVSLSRVPPQDAAIFGRYTYDETQRQYLRPPFEFFAIDFTLKFQASARCLDGINYNVQNCT